MQKNWDAICRELSSGEDSDEHDSLNVVKVQRNAHRVAELLRGVVLGDDAAAPPKGMNNADALRKHLFTGGHAGAAPVASPHSAAPATPAGAAEGTTTPRVVPPTPPSPDATAPNTSTA
jgi:hypothetical protein